jgi:hypothetical protein
MKKLLILSSVATLAVLNAMGQGQINLNPTATIGVLVQIQDTNNIIDGGTAVKIGTPATAAGFAGAGPGQVAIEIWGAPNGTALATAEATTPLFNAFNSASTLASAQGTYLANSVFVPTTANITGWNGSSALEFIVDASVTVNGTVYSAVGEATGVVQPATGNPPANIFGTGAGQISSFVLDPAPPSTPEPSTIALGGLGVAALLAFRRRK